MNEIITKYLLAGDKFMPEMHLKQPGLTYTVWIHLLRIKGFRKSWKQLYTRYIYQNESGKICFQFDMAYVVIKISSKEHNLIMFWEIRLSKLQVI